MENSHPYYQHPNDSELLEIFPEARKMVRGFYKKAKEEYEETEAVLQAGYAHQLKQIEHKWAGKEEEKFYGKSFDRKLAYKILYEWALDPLKQRLDACKRMVDRVTYKRTADAGLAGPEQIDRAKRYPIGELIRTTRGFVLCPFHNERTASLRVFPDNHFHCFGCGAHGDSIEFVRKQNNIGFWDAVTYLASK